VLTNPGRQDPGLAPKAKEQGLNAQDVTTSKQQAAFARQQQQAAQAAGDQSGAQAWRKEERAVERGRLATAISSNKQSQRSLFGVTEYDETMPLFKEQPASTPSTGGSLAVQSGGGAAARPTTTAPASKPGSVTEALRQTLGALKAADAKQMGMIAEQLFEAGWTIDRRTRYRGMSKDQARDKFKAEFAQKMQAQASSPEAAARSAAMRNRAGASGTVSGALKSALEDMKAQDKRLNDLQKQTIDLRIQAEEQFGGEGGEDPSLGGGRPRRRLGGSRRRDADILEARIDALKRKCTTGYGCGSACISLRKECRTSPSSAIGKERMKRLLALAAGGKVAQRGIAPVRAQEAAGLAAGIGQQRGAKAGQLRGARQQAAAKAAAAKPAEPGQEAVKLRSETKGRSANMALTPSYRRVALTKESIQGRLTRRSKRERELSSLTETQKVAAKKVSHRRQTFLTFVSGLAIKHGAKHKATQEEKDMAWKSAFLSRPIYSTRQKITPDFGAKTLEARGIRYNY
jgi:hypothetical protein